MVARNSTVCKVVQVGDTKEGDVANKTIMGAVQENGEPTWLGEIQVENGVIVGTCPMLKWSKGQTVEQTVKAIEKKGWPGPVLVQE